MNFSLRVICHRSGTETVKGKTAVLAEYLCFSEELTFRPYWKDDGCMILGIGGRAEAADYNQLRKYVTEIGGAGSVSVKGSSEEWECAYFATGDELHTRRDTAFVALNVF